MPSRPLSPHLSVYKFKYTLTTSILNRLTGVALSFALLLLSYWLMSVAGGTLAQQRAQRLLALPLMKCIYGALLFAFCYHLCAGIRHLVWDSGHGLERAQSRRSAWLIVIASVLMTLALGYALLHAGHTP
ncbi:MAG TPA: succinate dehydrogenase, cytochrome b556 subunit [Steroidobacteraceae bacterium]|nr:succinate dehydrogenase, cytochrome b556 subunit [Steroidobacteraceae bacterium]